MYRTLPQSPSVTAFGPGRKHSLLPALAKNMPPAYFLNASRPPGGSQTSPPPKGGQKGVLMSLPYKKDIIPLAKENRNDPTRQENHLWYDFLCRYPIRFQRQKTIDRFIADFYCHKAKLVIELDGPQHYSEEGIEKDRIRTEILEEYGLLVVRIPNRMVEHDFRYVCSCIDWYVEQRLSVNK